MQYVTQGFPGASVFIKDANQNESTEIIITHHIPNLDNLIDRFLSWMN